MKKKITLIEFYSSAYSHLHKRARLYTHTININHLATASSNIVTEQVLVRVKDVSFQRRLERLNSIKFPDASRQGIPVGGREQQT